MEYFLLGKGKQFSFKGGGGQLRLIRLPLAPFRFSRTFGEFLNLHLKASVLGLQLLGGIKSSKRSQKECSRIGSTSFFGLHEDPGKMKALPPPLHGAELVK